jgi:microcystin-dependent protein
MSDPFLGQIAVFGFDFAPPGWALCTGQIYPIAQNTALFSILGTHFGGDGKTTFGLPNLNGNVAMCADDNQYPVGTTGGAREVTLAQQNLPPHTHPLIGTTAKGTVATAQGNFLASASNTVSKQGSFTGNYLSTDPPGAMLQATAISSTGSVAAHNNMQPYLTLNFCIAVYGIFPSRS